MMERVKEAIAEQIFRVQVVSAEGPSRERRVSESRDFQLPGFGPEGKGKDLTRSEERRVGKECRSRWSPYH